MRVAGLFVPRRDQPEHGVILRVSEDDRELRVAAGDVEGLRNVEPPRHGAHQQFGRDRFGGEAVIGVDRRTARIRHPAQRKEGVREAVAEFMAPEGDRHRRPGGRRTEQRGQQQRGGEQRAEEGSNHVPMIQAPAGLGQRRSH
ncbi:hypothetical protein WR25_20578 [Diploscapter pachys]|uniref:Uncharacterized protein n=1 Tax=Diploscapter pachys TaxID=2018661 RepID=A0A2A2M2S9_9BILA|nr:hypothetical protein WR25_20578 [Diploscapter pachys]